MVETGDWTDGWISIKNQSGTNYPRTIAQSYTTPTDTTLLDYELLFCSANTKLVTTSSANLNLRSTILLLTPSTTSTPSQT